MKFCAIDPGTIKSGAALFDTRGKKLLQYKYFYAPTGKKWTKRIEIMARWIALYAEEKEASQLVIESPYFERSSRGMAAASQDSTIKIALMVGILLGRYRVPYHLYTPMEWKKARPKRVTHIKVCGVYPDQIHMGMDDNVLDACALGHWFLTQES